MRIINLLKTSILGLAIVCAAAGCGGGGGNSVGIGTNVPSGNSNWAEGYYSGSYTGSENGIWNATISDDGSISVNIESPSLGSFSGTGTLGGNGSFNLTAAGSGSASGYSITWSGTFVDGDGTVTASGAWRSTSGMSGTWRTGDSIQTGSSIRWTVNINGTPLEATFRNVYAQYAPYGINGIAGIITLFFMNADSVNCQSAVSISIPMQYHSNTVLDANQGFFVRKLGVPDGEEFKGDETSVKIAFTRADFEHGGKVSGRITGTMHNENGEQLDFVDAAFTDLPINY